MNCERCKDTGIWRTPRGGIEQCPELMLKRPHCSPTPNTSALRLAVEKLAENGEPIPQMPFEAAQILTRYSSATPCPLPFLEDHFFSETNLEPEHRAQRIAAVLDELRFDWGLDIQSNEAGCWLTADVQEFNRETMRKKAEAKGR